MNRKVATCLHFHRARQQKHRIGQVVAAAVAPGEPVLSACHLVQFLDGFCHCRGNVY